MSSSYNAKQPDSYFVKPAFQAVCILTLAHLFTLAVTSGIWAFGSWQISLPVAMLIQGAIAAILTRCRKLAPWWVLIQLLFPIALVALHALHIPSWIFLLTFIFLLSLFWTTFRTQVPYYPSGRLTWDAVATLLPADKPIRFIDIGSGMGGLTLALAAARPDSSFVGIEIAPLPCCISWLRNKLSGNKASFIRGDYRELDFSQFDVVFAYLSPAAMPVLWVKANAEMQPGALLLSYEFACPGKLPHCAIQPKLNGPNLYVWKF